MGRLTDQERETIICFNEKEKIASIYTYSPKWIKHLMESLGLKPKMSNHFGGKEFVIDKSRIVLPKAKRKVSTKMKKALEKARAAKKTPSAPPKASSNKKSKTSKTKSK